MGSISSTDIAIVGMACRYPGEARDPEGFLAMLQGGRDAWSTIPKSRFDIDQYYHPSHERQGNIVSQGGYFLEEDVALFDAPFFSMTAAEANAMDPQQRLMLESAYEALESAGIPMNTVVGTETSVYVGCFSRDYDFITGRKIDDTLLYQATGTGLAMLSNRLSWFFDFKGPSLTIDTACSSSLFAVHLACQSIRSGESNMSIVGGTGIILLPDIMRAMTALHFLSPDSKCYSFDDRANGYARGEGIGTLILKPVANAIRDGDTIRAVIRGTGSNQDGRTPGITLPSSDSQAKLIESTYRNAGLSLNNTQYFEAHGTGTPAGDPIELAAVGRTFGQSKGTQEHPLYVGSVKTNIGHLEGCAGLAGLMKGILSLETGFIFPSLNFQNPNPRLRLAEWNLTIPTESTRWPTSGTRRVSVNSFGYGGSNVHVILEDAYHYLAERELEGHTNTRLSDPVLTVAPSASSNLGIRSSASTTTYVANDGLSLLQKSHKRRVYVLSTPEQGSLTRLASNYSTYIERKGGNDDHDTFLASLAHTLASRRSIFTWRQAVSGSEITEVSNAMQHAVPVRSKKSPHLAMVFTGQGAQWFAMGRELMEYQAYADFIRRADCYLKTLGAQWSVIEKLGATQDGSQINEPEYGQPLCTVLQIALVNLLHHWGIEPSAVVGHSSGEIAAAYAAGALSPEDAWKIAFHRGRVSKRLSEDYPNLHGGMMAVGLSAEKARMHLGELESGRTAVVACVNSPNSVTIAGDVEALEQLEIHLNADDVFNRWLKVSNAYHSPHMHYVVDDYRLLISDIRAHELKPGCTFISSVTGHAHKGSDLGADYWCTNMTSPVRFLEAIEQVLSCPTVGRQHRRKKDPALDTFLELGPSGALQGPLKEIISLHGWSKDLTVLSMLSRGKDAIETSLDMVCTLWTTGYSTLNLKHVNQTLSNPTPVHCLCDTPRYPWNHGTRYWHESVASLNHRFPRAPRLDLLGAPVDDWNPLEPRWHQRLRISELPWIKEHVVQTSIIYPAAGFICAVLEAARQISDKTNVTKGFELRDISINRVLEFRGDSDVVDLSTSFKPRKLGLKAKDAPWIEWTIYSNGTNGYLEHCSGLLYIHYKQKASQIEGGREMRERNAKLSQEYTTMLAENKEELEPDRLYAALKGIGMEYGPLFRGVSSIRTGLAGSGCTTVTIPDTAATMPAGFEYDHLIHPCTLDAAFQSVFVALFGQSRHNLQAMVPTAIESIMISADQLKGAGSTYHGFAKSKRRGFREAVGTLYMSDESWSAPLLEVHGFSCTELGALEGGQALDEDATTSLRKMQSYCRWEADPTMFTPDMAQNIIGISKAKLDPVYNMGARTTVDLEQLSAIFGQRALKTLTKATEEQLPPHLVLYVQWLREQNDLAHRGVLPHQNGSSNWVTMSLEEEEQFITEKGGTSIDAILLTAVGRQLSDILDGSVLPLSVLMKDDMLFDIYANSFGISAVADQWETFFSFLSHKLPSMNILEVGAGTGSTTTSILKALKQHGGSNPRCSNYVFSDISSGFFEAAEKRFNEWCNFITYKRLDIEIDPLDQGFEAESFDVITASNVLHATKNIDKTLQNVLKLLKPGGHLVLGEITMPRARISMIYGTLPGWWLSEDGRTGGPCMSESQWADSFQRNGLRLDYTVQDVLDEKTHLMSFFCATKKERHALPFQKVLIIDNGSPSSQLDLLADRLQRSLIDCGVHSERCNLKTHVTSIAIDSSETPAIISLLEAEVPFLVKLDEWLLNVVQKLLHHSSGVLWITRGDRLGECDPNFRLIDGLIRTVRNEDQSLLLRTLDLEKNLGLDSEAANQCIISFFQSVFSVESSKAETEAAFVNGRFLIPRFYDDYAKNSDLQMLHKSRPLLLQPVKQEGRPLRLTIGVPGMLDTLCFIDDDDYCSAMPKDYVEIEVKATAMNFMDIMVSMGIVPDNMLGCDAAGIVTRVGSEVTRLTPGDRVACISVGTYRNILRAPEMIPQKIPSDMSFEAAATLLTVFVTAYQGLIEVGRLQANDTILIHAAAGGLGQAAIQLSKYIGAEIFVTVGSVKKKELIMNAYHIPEDHIFNSRDLTFADAVMRATNGQGVDMVLNSLAGEALRKTWTCIKPFGRFIEVGKKDILANTGLEMMPFLHNVIFAGVNIEHMYRHSVQSVARVSAKVFDLVRAHHITTVEPITVYSISEMETAFRTMQQGKHIGKIVLSFEDDQAQVPVVQRDQHPLQLRSDGTYLLVGGLGGLGRAQALWMAANGARYLAFISRSGSESLSAKKVLEKLTRMGICARAYACDVADSQAFEKALASLVDEMPRIYGVIQGAAVISDCFFSNMTIDKWNAAIRPKVQASWNLHNFLPKDLDFFIMLSSIAGLFGSRGQSNYAAGNTYQDALAHYRRWHGLQATTLDLGVMAEFGFVEENREKAQMNNLALILQPVAVQPQEFYSVLKSSITGYVGNDSTMPVQASIGLGTGGMIRAAGLHEKYEFYWHDDVKFSFLRHIDTFTTRTAMADSDNHFSAAITSASTLSQAVEIVQEVLTARLAKAMMVPLEDVDVSMPLSSYGVDSLAAIELRNWLRREMKVELSVFDLLSPVPLSQLIYKLTANSALVPNKIKVKVDDKGTA